MYKYTEQFKNNKYVINHYTTLKTQEVLGSVDENN